MALSGEQWLAALAAEFGTEPPSPDEQKRLLELASTAAHHAERWVAPLSCWLAAKGGVEPEAAVDAARTLAAGGTDDIAAGRTGGTVGDDPTGHDDATGHGAAEPRAHPEPRPAEPPTITRPAATGGMAGESGRRY